MEISSLISAIEEEFEDVEEGTLKADTKLKDIEGWDSMHSLILIARIDSDYGITISAEELNQLATVKELFQFIRKRV